MRYRLSASVPYDRIVQSNLMALQERPYPRQVASRICLLEDHRRHRRLSHSCSAASMRWWKDFEATVAVLRTTLNCGCRSRMFELGIRT